MISERGCLFLRRASFAVLGGSIAAVAVGAARPVHAQTRRDVSGVVRSAADSLPLEGVRVRVLRFTQRAESDAGGRFVLRSLPRVAMRLVLERVGIRADTVVLPGDRDTVTLYLAARPVQVSPLVAQGTPPARVRFDRLAQPSTLTLDQREITAAPSPMEADVARAAQLLPGTVAKNDFTVGLNVRGGESDQNLIRLDGITVFNPFHLGGLFSTFDPSAVSAVDLLTGAFPAEMGDRLSSVMDVDVRHGREDGFHAHAGQSLLSSRLLLEGPLGGGVTFLASARRTYTDLLTETFSDGSFGYYFADALAKLSVPVGRGRVSATGYWGRDALDVPWVAATQAAPGIDLAFSWGNRLAGITWNQPLGGVNLEHHVSLSRFVTDFALVPDVQRATNALRQLTARSALSWRISEVNDLRVGVGVEDHRIDYEYRGGAVNTELPVEVEVGGRTIPYDFRNATIASQPLDLRYRPRVWFGYVDEQWRPAGALIVRPGVRVLHVTGAGFTGIAPRLSIKVFLTRDLGVTASAGRYFQALHSIRDQEIPVTLFDYWIGADRMTPVARADHLVLGIERWFGAATSVTVEAYAKRYHDLPLKSLEDDPRLAGDEFVVATGSARGLDVLLRRHGGRVRGWIAYGLAKTTRNAQGETFPPAHDRRHTINVVLEVAGPWGGEVNVHWGYGSGLPYTGIVGQWSHREYNAELELFELPEAETLSTTINGERYPYYSRLDVGLRWQARWLGGTWRPYLNVVNVYNRRNVLFYVFDYDAAPPTRGGWSQLPFFPTAGVEVEW